MNRSYITLFTTFVLPSLRNTRMIRKQYENDTKANE